MSKKNRTRQARERAAALRAQQEAAERRRRLTLAGVAAAVVVAVVLAIIGAALVRKDPDKPSTDAGTRTLDAASLAAINGVPTSAFEAAGRSSTTNPPIRVKDASPVTKDGKPQILYVGAEYCPYCAGLRWSVAVALARFGRWTSLSEARSAQDGQIDPVSTVSFSRQHHGAAYTSPYVTFDPYETKTAEQRNGEYTSLDDFGGADEDLFKKYDYKPYVDAEKQGEGSIPFLSIGGREFQHGGLFQIDMLNGASTAQIAASLKDPKDAAAKQILANANLLTAAVCEQTGGKPAQVCTSPAVTANADLLKDK